MAFTRKWLKSQGIEDDELIDKLVNGHMETVSALKDRLEEAEASADELKKITKERDELKEQLSKGDSYKDKYDKLKKEYETYKADIDSEKTVTKKAEAYKALLKESGVSEKRIESVLKLAKVDGALDSIEVDSDGKIKDGEDVKKSIKSAYSEYIENTQANGASTAKPPANGGKSKLTKDEIYATDDKGRYKLSTSERYAAINELYNSSATES